MRKLRGEKLRCLPSLVAGLKPSEKYEFVSWAVFQTTNQQWIFQPSLKTLEAIIDNILSSIVLMGLLAEAFFEICYLESGKTARWLTAHVGTEIKFE